MRNLTTQQPILSIAQNGEFPNGKQQTGKISYKNNTDIVRFRFWLSTGRVVNTQAILFLRVSLSFFDQTLKTHYFWTDDARPNRVFLLKHLTQKLYADSISADSAPTSGSGEQLKIKTSNAIGFRYRRAEVSWLVSFDCIF